MQAHDKVKYLTDKDKRRENARPAAKIIIAKLSKLVSLV